MSGPTQSPGTKLLLVCVCVCLSRDGYGGRDDYGAGRGGGYSADRDIDTEREAGEYRYRHQLANRRMEESSAQSLRTLNECLNMGSDTAEELERQA